MIRNDLPPMPWRIAKLPVNENGYPVPWFVHWADGKPDFRIIGKGKLAKAHNEKRCWICGDFLGRFKAFVIGPMCAVNRVSSEPPSHLDCADFSARACPFLVKPRMHRRTNDLPEGTGLGNRDGIAIERNPGVALVWVTLSYTPFRVPNGILFKVGSPISTRWYALGKPATTEQIMESINSGLPILQDMAKEGGPEAEALLASQVKVALKLVGETAMQL